jgi:hypothetical protein
MRMRCVHSPFSKQKTFKCEVANHRHDRPKRHSGQPKPVGLKIYLKEKAELGLSTDVEV